MNLSVPGWRYWLPPVSVGAIAVMLATANDSPTAAPSRAAALAQEASGEPLGFPLAIGYGAESRGGRNGRIIAVTSLDDSGPGTLRNCVEQRGPRVCIFRVGGVIRFTSRPPIITEPYLTIAGQTAPSPGITLAHGGGEEGRTPLLIKGTHDVIVRQIRVRNDREGTHRGSEDSITIENSEKVIIDHVSASWARDELVNGYGDNDRVTISNSIFAEGIAPHDKCALLASDPVDAQRLSFIGNLCAHNGDRNPDINFPPSSCAEVINNVLYNAQSQFAEIWSSFGGSPVSLVGNSFIAGPKTTRIAIGIARNHIGAKGDARVHAADNRFEGNFIQTSPDLDQIEAASPICPLTIKPRPAATAFDAVLASAGAFPRDEVDRRVVEDVRRRSGTILKVPGAIPAAAMRMSTAAYPDEDGDGMDDRWEASAGADPHRADAWSDSDGDGVPNLEEFLEHRDRELQGSTI